MTAEQTDLPYFGRNLCKDCIEVATALLDELDTTYSNARSKELYHLGVLSITVRMSEFRRNNHLKWCALRDLDFS